MTTEEDRQLHKLLDVLTVVEEWQQLSGQLSGAWTVHAGSALRGDDTLTQPYHLSSSAWAAITAAVSHASCLRDSLFEWHDDKHATVRLHTHAQFTLIRGALENASLSIWLLESDDRATRVLRRLQQERSEVKALAKMQALMGSPIDQSSMQEQMGKLSSLAEAAGADPSKLKQGQPGYQDIVESAGAHIASGAQNAAVIWKACSAIAHGEFRALPTYLAKDLLGHPAPGVGLHRVTANVQLTVVGTQIAVATTKVAFALYAQRAQP